MTLVRVQVGNRIKQWNVFGELKRPVVKGKNVLFPSFLQTAPIRDFWEGRYLDMSKNKVYLY